MYMCDFYQILSIKGGYKDSSSVYITYTEKEMICQKNTIVPCISIQVIATLSPLIE
jgi:hypothetical protein